MDDKQEEPKKRPSFSEMWGSYKRMLVLAKSEWKTLLIATIFLGVGASMGLTFPLIVGDLVDTAIQNPISSLIDAKADTPPAAEPGTSPEEAPDMSALLQQKKEIKRAALLLLGIFLVQGITTGFRFYLFSLAGFRIVTNLRSDTFRAIINQEIGFFDERKTGELINRLAADTTTIQNTVSVNISMLLRSVVLTVGGVILMFVFRWELAMITLTVVPIVVVTALWFGRIIRRLAKGLQDALANAGHVAQESISGVRTVRAFTRENYEYKRYRKEVLHSLDLTRKRILHGSFFQGVVSFAGYGAIALVVWYGASLIVGDAANGKVDAMTAGDLMAFVLFALTVAGSLATLGALFTDFMAALGASDRIFQILDRKPQGFTSDGARLENVDGRIEFENVGFTYPTRTEMPALKQVSFTIEPGTVVALVGPSGSGKSTIGNLVPRFYDAQEGRITLDGKAITELDTEWLREKVGSVPQEPILFSCNIAENIAYGKLDATPEEIREAAKVANAHQFIEEFPKGYETDVGERGVRLSGGQKQRIAIARAVLRNPRILILDEATSALDSESEYLVKEALTRLMTGRTTIIIAHRLSTVKHADRVLVLDKGSLAEIGTHDELMAEKDGIYRKLVERQYFDSEAMASHEA